jgi:integrase/recombinase XerD
MTTKFNPANERIKHSYFRYLKHAKRLDEQSIDANAKALDRFEDFTGRRDYGDFRSDHAAAFKDHLVQCKSAKDRPLSKATIVSTLNALKRFFSWLPGQTGYKSRLSYEWAEYFNPSLKDVTIARAPRRRAVPTLDQVDRLIRSMPTSSPIERRDRAVVVLIALTGARDDAVASLKLKHIDIGERMIFQDGRDVRTKFSKTISSWFFPIGDHYEQILVEWVRFLRDELGHGSERPLFPQTATVFTDAGPVLVLGDTCWASAQPIRRIFKQAFERAGIPYFNPHSFRHMLVQIGMAACKGAPEALKSWSQNLGHSDILTTLNGYGEVPPHRQRELVRGALSLSDDDQRALEIGRAALAAAKKAEKS